MSRIGYYIEEVKNGVELLSTLLIEEFGIDEPSARRYAEKRRSYFEAIKETCWLLAEAPYVDKVFRDSYYSYYSSKRNEYNRDCVRISIFAEKVELNDFRNKDRVNFLMSNYRGFIIIRPTVPQVTGRSAISPKALKENDFSICAVKIQAAVNAIKLEVEAFPNSSQDTETITCAETTIWALMEYFGNKYSHYKPVLPSKIIETLNRITSERQIPSKGLNIFQMSYALKEFGFSTRIYSENSYKNDFKRLFSCYIESGIPLVLELSNFHLKGTVGHANLCVGLKFPDEKEIDAVLPCKFTRQYITDGFKAKKAVVYDWDDIDKKFIFIDDNFPAYQKATFTEPAKHYTPANPQWGNCQIKNFIAPLYPKIYLEAYEAKNYLLHYLIYGHQPLADNSEVLIRFYLTSSRSYKHELALNETIDPSVKGLLIDTPMPKFIWVAEMSDKPSIKKKLANGILILDATEANINVNMMIFTAFQGEINIFGKNTGIPANYAVSLPPFRIYENNLKSI